MTINEISKKLFNLSAGGYFNHEKFTEKRLSNYIDKMFHDSNGVRCKSNIVMEIALDDGWWLFHIDWIDGYGFDFTIPNTREQEKQLKMML